MRERYKNFQTFIKDGCYFLSLCSIAEDASTWKVDVIDAYVNAINKGYAAGDSYIQNPCAILRMLTNKSWSLRIESSVPSTVAPNEYTILKYHNARTGFTHFRRRDVDTLKDSVTVREGKVVACYVFAQE